jgi:hypothetical protein
MRAWLNGQTQFGSTIGLSAHSELVSSADKHLRDNNNYK